MSLSIADITEEISTAGFWVHQNAHIGPLVDRIIAKKYNLYSVEGLSLFRAAVLQNNLVSNVIKSLVPEPTFVFCRVFGQSRTKNCILNRKDDPRMRIVTVFCWSSKSKGTIYSGSHSRRLQAKDADNGMLKITDEALAHGDIQHCAQDMASGGLTIVDARCGWQITKGKCILLGFAIPDEREYWLPMSFPPPLQDAVTNMMSGTNITIRASFDQPDQPPAHIITATGEEEQAKTRSGVDEERAHDATGDQL